MKSEEGTVRLQYYVKLCTRKICVKGNQNAMDTVYKTLVRDLINFYFSN